MDQIQILFIEDLSAKGAGVGRTPQGVIFVPFSVPGDTVRVRITEQHKSYAFAELLEIITASDKRVKPPCSFFGRCGGCQWQHIDYPLQWETKKKAVSLACKRSNVVIPDLQLYPAKTFFGYRNRIQMHGSDFELGFFEENSQKIVDVDQCAVASQPINLTLPKLRQDIKEKQPSEKRDFKVEIESFADQSVRLSWDQPHAALGFRQVNEEQNRHLQDWIQNAFTLDSGGILWDLFGGNGNLSVGLSKLFNQITCVDTHVSQKDFKNIRFVSGGVASFLKAQSKNPPSQVKAIFDPPRGGIGFLKSLLKNAFEKIPVSSLVHVGCDLDHFAADLAFWQQLGFKVEKIAAFDFFPQTIHVETAAFLKKQL
jgi:tRNA/tmRNA/rRNA uracil-C5-methylase (TrmA/RlmC/RlmD family)